ncbi:carbohydrate ABC transporter permease [Lachnoclostridium sp. Marseille-P6806]|uniref:carbohydrate ABC transporter permease n=1 Tax=Lachnoclostridium sp. Marseille-P6806 TaxID=2364793 RepID=UPI0010303465|nr:sugar ABC transporter permease [Lachnoclostridium sp. Marseille-P6806]
MTRKKRQALYGVLYILPSLILLIMYAIIPIFMTLYFSMTDYNMMKAPAFVGISNFLKAFKDSYVRAAAKNTLVYSIITVPLQTILALVFAAFLAVKLKDKRFGGLLRSLMFIPVIASGITAATIWRIILATDGGMLNSILGIFGGAPVNWLGDTGTSLISVCIVAIWKNIGYFLVIYYAGIMAIPTDLYEAAEIDGATALQQFFRVTLPLLKSITYLVVTLGIIWSFQVFDLSYQMTGGGPGKSTVTLVMGIYNSAFKQNKMGYACSQAIILLAVVLIVNLIENQFFKEKD